MREKPPELASEGSKHLHAVRDALTPLCLDFAQQVRADLGHTSSESGEHAEIPEDVLHVAPGIQELFRNHVRLEPFRAAFLPAQERESWMRAECEGSGDDVRQVLAVWNQRLARIEAEFPHLKESECGRFISSLEGSAWKGFRDMWSDIEWNMFGTFFMMLDRTKERLRAADRFAWSKLQSPRGEFVHSHLALPIGEYGEETTKKILLATHRMLGYVQRDSLASKSQRITSQFEGAIGKIARAEGRQSMSLAPLRALHEGVVTIAQSLSLLVAEKVNGFENADDLITALVEGNVVNDFARAVPAAVIGPASLSGHYIHGLVEKIDGQPVLSQRLIEDEWTPIRQADRADEHQKKLLPAVGRGCPVAYGEGVKEMTKVFFETYKLVR